MIWEAEKFGNAWAVYKAGSRYSPDRIAFVYVVETSEGNPSEKLTEANAYLLAAAPEVLESLEEVTRGAYIAGAYGSLCSYCGYHDRTHNKVCRIGRAEAVIAKAKGDVA